MHQEVSWANVLLCISIISEQLLLTHNIFNNIAGVKLFTPGSILMNGYDDYYWEFLFLCFDKFCFVQDLNVYLTIVASNKLCK
jgi:hypothetical protein